MPFPKFYGAYIIRESFTIEIVNELPPVKSLRPSLNSVRPDVVLGPLLLL